MIVGGNASLFAHLKVIMGLGVIWLGFLYRWDHTDLDVDRDLFDLNVFAPVNLSRLVMPHFHAQPNGGTFVIVSSLAGRFGVPFSGTYTGSKHAINVSHPKTPLSNFRYFS